MGIGEGVGIELGFWVMERWVRYVFMYVCMYVQENVLVQENGFVYGLLDT